jgi:ABC-2 type transport system permease protein
VTTSTAPGPGRLRWLVADSLAIAGRSLAHIRQIPEKLFDVTLQPLMFVLLFSFVFGGVIAVPGGGDYHEYLIGGILVQTLAFGMMGPGVSMATDLGEGILDRFRSLPMLRPAFLLGHLTAELAASVLAIAIMVVSGLIVGWQINSDPLEALACFGLLGLLAITMLWLGTLIGVIARSPDVVQGIAFLVIFPLTFVASTFVPVAGLPRRPPPDRRIQPGQRLGGGGANPVRQSHRDAGRRRLAAAAPGPRLGPLVPGDPRHRHPPDPARLSPSHHRLTTARATWRANRIATVAVRRTTTIRGPPLEYPVRLLLPG